jgi:undecaprenyl-diphosphatase
LKNTLFADKKGKNKQEDGRQSRPFSAHKPKNKTKTHTSFFRLFRLHPLFLALGVFYIVVGLTYALFEFVVINYRPVLIEGILEASYPSSTTMLASSVMPTAMLQLRKRIANKKLQTVVLSVTAVFTVFMVVGRLIAGVHWFSDIVGGLLFSGGAVLLYYTAAFVD